MVHIGDACSDLTIREGKEAAAALAVLQQLFGRGKERELSLTVLFVCLFFLT